MDFFYQEQIFIALRRGKLIEDRATSQYSRCGRTDKGVSAFGQVSQEIKFFVRYIELNYQFNSYAACMIKGAKT